MTDAEPALEAEGVAKRYASVVALDGVSLSVAAGECIALVGESGSGKTTLLRCFNRMVEPDDGRIRVRGTDVREPDPATLRRRIGYVPQEGGLMPHWRVLRNVELVPRLQHSDRARELATDALELVGLDPADFGDRRPRELSGGQRQRVALARALAAHPDVVLLDEPFGALDAITRTDLEDTFRELQRRLRVTALLVTHDLRQAVLLADRIAVLRNGRLHQIAAPDALVSDPATDYVRNLIDRAGVGSA